MKWLPVMLMLAGFNPGQASQLTAAIESIWIGAAASPVSALILAPFRRVIEP